MSRVVFAGTPEFAREALCALTEAGIAPVAVLTQPDRPAGRGKKLRASAVKNYAEQHNLPLLQPSTLKHRDTLEQLDALHADLFVVAAYGLLLPKAVLELPRIACVNVHASVLPRWRGAAPVQAAILAGDRTTGISLMQMDAGLDTGPVYASSTIAIGADETAGELQDRLARLGGDTLVARIEAILDGRLVPQPQDNSLATYAAKIETADAMLDWRRSANELQRLVRAYNPFPGAWTSIGNERLKCWRAQAIAGDCAEPGTVVSATAAGIDVATQNGVLRLTELQRPGKKRVTAAEFAGQLMPQGRVLGQRA